MKRERKEKRKGGRDGEQRKRNEVGIEKRCEGKGGGRERKGKKRRSLQGGERKVDRVGGKTGTSRLRANRANSQHPTPKGTRQTHSQPAKAV